MVTTDQVIASSRAREAVPSPMRKLTPLAEAAVGQGVRIYHLNIGQPDIPTPEALMERIREYEGRIVPYAPSHGLHETVAAWQEYYARLDISLERGELLVTSGGSEALMFALMAAADPGDEVIVFEPTYANYFGFARMAAIRIVPVTIRPEDGYHLPAREEIEARITPRTKGLLFASPGNPTGAVFSYDELTALSEVAARHDLFLISDETYREIVFEGPGDMSMVKVGATADQTILVDSVSKRFSATGTRIGCVASRHRGIMDGIMRFAQARLSAATVEQQAVVPLLRDSRRYTDPLVQTYRERRDIVYSALRQIPGVLVRRPEGAFYVFAVLPIDDGERFARWLLTDFRLDGETLMIAPGDGFYFTPGMGKQEVRFAFVLDREPLERSMTLLREALRVYPGAQEVRAHDA